MDQGLQVDPKCVDLSSNFFGIFEGLVTNIILSQRVSFLELLLNSCLSLLVGMINVLNTFYDDWFVGCGDVTWLMYEKWNECLYIIYLIVDVISMLKSWSFIICFMGIVYV